MTVSREDISDLPDGFVSLEFVDKTRAKTQ